MTGTENRKNKLPLILVLVIALTVASPVFTGSAFAAPWEDCDFDGYDDHTGKKLPWPGFDETRGDVLPAGWDFGESENAGSDGEEKKAAEKKETGATKKKESTKEKSAQKKNNSSADSKKTDSVKQSEPETDGSAGKQSDASASQKEKASASATADSSDGEKTTQEAAATSAAVQKTAEDLAAERAAAEKASEAAILSQKGSLAVADAEGGAIAPGSTLIITGSGFAGNVNELEVQLHSASPRKLDAVTTRADGSFSLRVTLPDQLEAGAHDIVLLYRGNEITREPIQVSVPKAAEREGNEQLAGILILAGLAVAGAIVLVITRIRRSKKSGRRQAAGEQRP